ncbi:MAG: hypothetical protein WCW77_00625 [Patescibacteria group bacterium]|jgi:hypothetical protein
MNFNEIKQLADDEKVKRGFPSCFGKYDENCQFCTKECRCKWDCMDPGDKAPEPKSKARAIIERYQLENRRDELNKSKQFEEAREIEADLKNLAYA